MALRWVYLLLFVFAAFALPLVSAGQPPLTRIVHTVPPIYPLAAKAAGIEGKVIVKMTIGKDGRTRNVRAIEGPVELRQAAVDAVSLFVYHPHTYLGKPVEIDATIRVNFTMGSKKEKQAAQAAAQQALAGTSSNNATPAPPPDSLPKGEQSPP